MITETPIVWMFLNSHNLNAIVSFLCDTRKYLFTKFIIASNFLFLLCHADMAFVNQQRISGRLKCLLPKFIGVLRSPHLRTEYLCLFILNHPCSPSWNTFTLTTIPIYIQFVQVSMMNSIFRKIDFPNSILQFLQLVSSFFFPIIECTYHINMCSIRCPFTKSPSFGSTMQSEVKISRCKVRKSLLSFIG